MTKGVPVLDPARDLAGATPETLAAALFRNENPALRPGARRQRDDSKPTGDDSPKEDG